MCVGLLVKFAIAAARQITRKHLEKFLNEIIQFSKLSSISPGRKVFSPFHFSSRKFQTLLLNFEYIQSEQNISKRMK